MTFPTLSEAIEQIRDELGKAQDAGALQQLRFKIVEAELELLLEQQAGGGLKLAVAGVGGEGQRAKNRTHKLTLKLEVLDKALGGSHAEVSDDTPRNFD